MSTHGADNALLRRAMWRVGLQVTGSVAAIVVVLSAIAVLIVLRAQHDDAVASLHQSVATADDVDDPPAHMWLAIRTQNRLGITPQAPHGFPDAAALRAVERDSQTRSTDLSVGSKDFAVYTMRRGDAVVQAALDLTADYRERDHLAEALSIAGGTALVLSAGLGVWTGRRAVRPLAAALAVQHRFVSDASHELRTPLTQLSTRAQMLRRHLRRDAEPAMIDTEMDGVVRDTRQLAAILDDLLFAADPRNQRLDEVADLVELARDACTAAQATAIERSVRIHAHTDQENAFVLGSPVALRRALTALLDNAIRHAAQTVTVTVRNRGKQVVVDVNDDGPGIDSAILPHLFERFASAEDRGSEDDNGQTSLATAPRRYGIGLALVSEIATRHGGSVTATPGANGGATFQLVLLAAR
jgi:signal transduction histidine kinase